MPLRIFKNTAPMIAPWKRPITVLTRSVHCLLVTVMVIGATPVVFASSDSAAQALQRQHRSFVGWQLGDGTFGSLRLTRLSIDASGNERGRTIEIRAGLLYRTTRITPAAPLFAQESGYDGKTFWLRNVNGFVMPVGEQLARERLSYAMLFNEGITTLHADFRGDVVLDGQTLAVLHADVPGGDAVDVYEDPTSGAYVRAIIDSDGDHKTMVQILSYIDALPGKKIIGSYRLGAKSTGRSVYTLVEPNVANVGNVLSPQPPVATWAFNNPSPFPITVTSGRVFVDASVNGVKGRFLLDTGSVAIFLNERFADRAQVIRIGSAGTAVSMNGTVPAQLRKAGRIDIGGNTLSNATVVAEDFSAMGTRAGDAATFDGLLGFDLFAGAVVTLNFGSRTMSIQPPNGSPANQRSGTGFDIDTTTWIPAVHALLNHGVTVNAMLDTGASGEIVMSSNLLDEVAAHSDTLNAECATLDQLKIGPLVYQGPTACVRNTVFTRGNNIVVGFGILRRMSIIFDYPHGRLFLE